MVLLLWYPTFAWIVHCFCSLAAAVTSAGSTQQIDCPLPSSGLLQSSISLVKLLAEFMTEIQNLLNIEMKWQNTFFQWHQSRHHSRSLKSLPTVAKKSGRAKGRGTTGIGFYLTREPREVPCEHFLQWLTKNRTIKFCNGLLLNDPHLFKWRK